MSGGSGGHDGAELLASHPCLLACLALAAAAQQVAGAKFGPNVYECLSELGGSPTPALLRRCLTLRGGACPGCLQSASECVPAPALQQSWD